jgi:hypothetical protein
MFGARTLAEHIKRLEVLGNSGDVSSAPAVFAQVEMEYDRVKRAIEGILREEAA